MHLIFSYECKSETRLLIRSFHSCVKTQFNKKIKILRSDNGWEFDMTDFYCEKGIIHETSCVDTPQLGAKENVARALRFQAGLPLQFGASVYWLLLIL